MNKTAKWFIVMLVALILLVILSPIVFVIQIVYRLFSRDYDLWYYFNAIAVNIDDLGASLLYGSKHHTISAITKYKAYNGSLWHKLQEKLINLLLQDNNHCYNEAINEKLIKDGDDS
jgi:hypothetical protein